jgi:hypothetical protein
MRAKLDAQVQTLQVAYFNQITGEGSNQAVMHELKYLLELYVIYKTNEQCIFEQANLSDLLLNQGLAENFILPHLKSLAENKAYEGAIFELFMAAKTPAELVAKCAASLQALSDAPEDLIERGLQELREIYDIAVQLYREGNTQKTE